MRHTLSSIALALALGACGASSQTVSHSSDPDRVAVDQAKPGDSSQPATITAPAPYGADPLLSVYVRGPEPIDGQSGIDASAGAYRTEITVINEGDAPAEIGQARVWFEVWRGDERLPCAQERFFETPPTLEPGESHVLQVRAGCALPGSGEYEVRAYLAFGAEGGDVDLERYFAGRYFVEK